MAKNPWAITIEQADTLPAMFRERVVASGNATAYIQFDSVSETISCGDTDSNTDFGVWNTE